MTYTVIVQPQAEREFEVLYSYIAARSQRGASRWANAYFKMLMAIKNSPAIYPLAPESALHDEDIRQSIFRTRKGLSYSGSISNPRRRSSRNPPSWTGAGQSRHRRN